MRDCYKRIINQSYFVLHALVAVVLTRIKLGKQVYVLGGHSNITSSALSYRCKLEEKFLGYVSFRIFNLIKSIQLFLGELGKVAEAGVTSISSPVVSSRRLAMEALPASLEILSNISASSGTKK